jgi:flagellar export protein FliJ
MNKNTLNMILKLKEFEEEVEKQKYTNFLSEMKNIENYIKEIEERFVKLKEKKEASITTDDLNTIYNEIIYLTNLSNEARKLLLNMEKEVEKQREIYEEFFKERKKIERLYEKLILLIKREREKLEEKMISDILSGRYRSI